MKAGADKAGARAQEQEREQAQEPEAGRQAAGQQNEAKRQPQAGQAERENMRRLFCHGRRVERSSD